MTGRSADTAIRAAATAVILFGILVPFAVITYAAGLAASAAWRGRR